MALTRLNNRSLAANAAITADKLSVGPLAGMRNRIINGDMKVAQRATSWSNVNSVGYKTVDRWYNYANYGGVYYTVEQSTDAPPGFKYSLKTSYYSGTYATGGTGYVMHRYNTERNHVDDLKYGSSDALTTTWSLWVKAKRTGTFTVSILTNGGNSAQRHIARQGTITAADTWQKFIFTIPGDTLSSFNEAYNASGFYFDIIAGIENSWKSGASLNTSWNNNDTGKRAVGQTDFIQTSGDYFSFTGVQLEVGEVATPYEFRSYDHELSLCQRYYERISDLGSDRGVIAGVWNSSTNANFGLMYTEKRVNPSLQYGGTFTVLVPGTTWATASSLAIDMVGKMSCRLLAPATGGTNGQASLLRPAEGWIALDAEL